MKTIQVKKKEISNWKDYVKRPAREDDFETLITESCRIMCGDDVVGVYVVPPKDDESELLRQVVRRVNTLRNRRTVGLTTNSKVFGYLPREVIRKDYCSAAQLATANPKYHAIICNYGKTLAKYYKEYCPEMFDYHDKLAKDEVKQEWRIKETPFTSGILNKNTQLNYHWDRGNFQKVYSNMVAFRRNCAGGHLSIPEYNIGLEVEDLSLTLFAGQEILHGVTPFKFTKQGGYRFTLVYYSLKQMWKCEEVSAEVARIRDRKTVREKNRLLRQQGKLDPDSDPIGNLVTKVKDKKQYKNYDLFTELGIDHQWLGLPFTKLPKEIQKKLVEYKQKPR